MNFNLWGGGVYKIGILTKAIVYLMKTNLGMKGIVRVLYFYI